MQVHPRVQTVQLGLIQDPLALPSVQAVLSGNILFLLVLSQAQSVTLVPRALMLIQQGCQLAFCVHLGLAVYMQDKECVRLVFLEQPLVIMGI